METIPQDNEKVKAFAPYVKILRRELGYTEDTSNGFDTGEPDINKTRISYISHLHSLFLTNPYSLDEEDKVKLENFLDNLILEPIEADDREGLKEIIVNKTIKFISDNFTLEEFEYLIQNNFISSTAYPEKLNRTVAFDLIRGKEIDIHILPTIINNPLEIRPLIIDGFRELATKIKNDDKYNSVEKISGISWIIDEYPKFVSSLGFEIVTSAKKEGFAKAEITRDKFLELYS